MNMKEGREEHKKSPMPKPDPIHDPEPAASNCSPQNLFLRDPY